MAAAAMKFELPSSLNATMPPERRGVRRDFVNMMVLDRMTGRTTHARFYELDRFLQAGDLLVLNASRTVPAVLRAEWRRDRVTLAECTEVRLAKRLDAATWEVWIAAAGAVRPAVGDVLRFSPELYGTVSAAGRPFVTVTFSLAGTGLFDEIYKLGEPVRYEYIDRPWSLDYYQTVFATAPGSVEMPSAGRAFSWELLLKLRRKGVRIAFVRLHTGLSYLSDEYGHPDPRDNAEEYEIPAETAEAVRCTRTAGGKVIGVGTTVVRSLESAVNERGEPTARSGWTRLRIDQTHRLQAVDGLITGFHEPEASHLDLLSAFIDPKLLCDAYQEAIERRYLWHEFGDINLIL